MTYPQNDHYNGNWFSNQDKSVELKSGLKNILKWYFQDKKHPWPNFIANNVTPNLPSNIVENEIYISFINHATLLVQFKSLTILTDPVFSKRVSPLNWLGPKRIREPGIALNQLPKIDVITISHNHYDHMDLSALKKLHHLHQPLFIVPLGNAKFLQSIGIKNIVELDWWQSHTVTSGYNITLVPAQHWSARGFHDRNKSLWGGYVYTYHTMNVYFAGDTGYNGHFQQIYERFGAMDVSLLPIGAYEPRWFMKEQHINPEEAVLAHIDLHSKLSIGMHFGTFALANEGVEHPIRDLKISLENHQLTKNEFIVLEQGETRKYTKTQQDSF